jgi:L-cystine transport system permease protein
MWELFLRAAPTLLEALWVTIFLGLVSFAIGSTIGLSVALIRMSNQRVLKAAVVTYVSIFLGTPMLVQILLIYFGLPQIGIRLDPIPSGILALSLNVGAYQSENFRAGLLGVDHGQREAAYSIGMSYWQAMRRILFPQALRIAAPPIGTRFIALMKDTSLVSVITVTELTRAAERVGSATFRYLEMYLIVAAVYWVLNLVLSLGQAALERRLGRPY